jgi:hypothetical protein
VCFYFTLIVHYVATSALTRPGRLEKHVQLGLPSAAQVASNRLSCLYRISCLLALLLDSFQRRDILEHLLKGLVDTTLVNIDRVIDTIVSKTEDRYSLIEHLVPWYSAMFSYTSFVFIHILDRPLCCMKSWCRLR